MNGNQVQVLYNLDYQLEDDHIVIKEGERLNLIAKSSHDWWLVSRLNASNDETSSRECEKTRSESEFKSKSTSTPNQPFFVPSAYIRSVDGYMENNSDLFKDKQMIKLKNDLDDSEKASDEAIGSSRDSLEVIDNLEMNSISSKQSDLFNCDSQSNGKSNCDRLEGIYVDPVEFKVMPRKVRQEPEYANLSPLNFRKDFFKLKVNKCPPSVGEPNTHLKRLLFDDWAEYEDESGRRFYYNTISQFTSWKPPRRLTAKVEDVDAVVGHKDAQIERKLSLDSQLVLNHDPSNNHSQTQRFEQSEMRLDFKTSQNRPNSPQGTNDSQQGHNSTREQSTQTECDLDHNETQWVIPNVPTGWQGFINALTKEVFFVSQLNNRKWFCKRDENGRIYFYEENGQGMLAELPPFDDDDARRYLPQDNSQMRDKQGTKSGLKLSPKSGEGLQVNLDRSIKAHSVALLPSRNVKPDMVIFKEKFKHTSPFQNMSVIFPPPPTSLNMKDIINSGTLNRTRTVVASKVSKRKNWGTSYVVLTKFYLLFFKDQKLAFVHSGLKPDFVLGLLNASIDWCPNKSSRKNCFQVSTFQDQVLLQDDSNDHSAKWFSAIRDSICKLPTPLNTSSMKTTSTSDGTEKSGSFKLKRSRSTKQYRPNEEFAMQSGRATLSGYATIANTPMNDKKVKIRERLRQFLRKRPTMESLREKGIIKDENVFGCSLDMLCHRDKSPIPKFVQQCVEAIEYKDLKADGIYRACGNLSTVQKLRFEINQDNYQGLWKEEDVHVLTGLLKMFFRNMPEPLFPCDRFESLMRFIGIKSKETKIDSFRKLIHELPENNFQTLKFIMRHLLRITEHHLENRMSVQNLAIVFGPTLIWPMNDLNNLVLDMMLQMQQSQVIEFLLLEYDSIFN